MKRSELRNARVLSRKGGTINFVSDEGELLSSVWVPAGDQRVLPYLAYCPPGASVEFDGLEVFGGGSAFLTTTALATATDANPDWQPLSLTPAEEMMRRQMHRMELRAQRAERRARLERVRQDAEDGEDVLEDDKSDDKEAAE